MVELLGLLFFALNVAGNLMLTRMSLRGWYVRMAANVAQIAYALAIHSPSHVLNGSTFLVINCVGVYRWRRRVPAPPPGGTEGSDDAH